MVCGWIFYIYQKMECMGLNDSVYTVQFTQHAMHWCHMQMYVYQFCVIGMCDSKQNIYKSQSHHVNKITKLQAQNAVAFRKNRTFTMSLKTTVV